MVFTYDEILTICKNKVVTHPDSLIYVAIGCSQAHYPPTGGTPQQFPPFVAAHAGHKICIWIDPGLEPEPRGFQNAGLVTQPLPDNTIADVGFATFIPLRKNFAWPRHWGTDSEVRPCTQFIDELCRLCVHPVSTASMIVQDYSGADIRQFYPLERFGPALLAKVLFDVTYKDSGCFVDFARVHILRNNDGFVQPAYSPMWSLATVDGAASVINAEMGDRYNTLINYVWRLYKIQTGREVPRDWCTPDVVATRARRLFIAYRLPQGSTDTPTLHHLLVEGIFDFCSVAGHYQTHADTVALIDGDNTTLPNALNILRLVASENRPAT
jgi:hypothetical protein